MTESANDAVAHALSLLEVEYDQLRVRLAKIEHVMATLRPLVESDSRPAPATREEPAPRPTAPTPPITVEQDAGRVCDGCGKTFSKFGYGTHRRNCRGAAPKPSVPAAIEERHRKVAEIWRAGGSTVASRNRAVAAHFGVSGQAAGQYIRQARAHGFLSAAVHTAQPTVRPVEPSSSPVGAVVPMLDCPHCPTTFFSEEARAVHVRRKHANDEAELDAAMDARFPRTAEPPAVMTREPTPAPPAWTPERAREHLEAIPQ